MSHGDARPGDGGHEPLGSVGEEAAKLFDALQEWARDGAGGGNGNGGGGGFAPPQSDVPADMSDFGGAPANTGSQ